MQFVLKELEDEIFIAVLIGGHVLNGGSDNCTAKTSRTQLPD